MINKTSGALALFAVSALALAGCSAADAPSASGSAGGPVKIVASTNVYGSIAEAVGGDHVDVTSLIASVTQDPHEYEATAADQLTVKNAQLLIENGGGYDPFLDQLISATGTEAPVITAVELSPHWPGSSTEPSTEASDDHDHDHAEDDADHGHVEGFNEHVFYDLAVVSELAHEIAHELAELDEANAASYEANALKFQGEIATLTDRTDALAAAHKGEGVFVTEPLPLYLTEAAGLQNVTPEEFSEAVEEGTDVAPAVLLEALGIIGDGKARVVIVNAQAAGAETTEVENKATEANVPVLKFSELVPEGQGYIEWMSQNITELEGALS